MRWKHYPRTHYNGGFGGHVYYFHYNGESGGIRPPVSLQYEYFTSLQFSYILLHTLCYPLQTKPDARCISRCKAVPLQAWSGPEGSRKSRFPHSITTAQDCGKVVNLTHRPPLPPRKYTWYLFLLEAESTPGP